MIISKQAIILMICNFIVFMLLLLNTFITKTPSRIYIIIVLFFIILPFMLLQIYSLNCMVTGECYAWSWIIAYIAIAFTVLYVIGFIVMIRKLKQTGPTGPTGPEEQKQLKA